jgi:uncharacterized membrane protein
MNFAPDRYHQKNKSKSHIALRSVSFALYNGGAIGQLSAVVGLIF